MSAAVAVGVDIGGTKLAAGLVDSTGSVRARLRRDTPAHDPDGIVKVVVEAVAELRASAQAADAPVGVGAAGLIDPQGVVRYAPNIDWADFPLAERLAAAVGGRVAVDNDANTAAWAEFRCGAGQDAEDSLVMLTVGTGVGGGLVLGGGLVRGANGLGAEFGHIVVDEGGPRCSCGNRGCLEALASGSAIGRYAEEQRAAGRLAPGSALTGVQGGLTGKIVTHAARAGDADAIELLERCGFWLGVGIASLINALDPDAVVVGGGAMAAGELLLGTAREAAMARIVGADHRTPPPILLAGLADDGGLIGAALLALA